MARSRKWQRRPRQGDSDIGRSGAEAEPQSPPHSTGSWWCHRPRPPYPTPTGCRRICIPIYGWMDADDDHRARVDRCLHVPMLLLALMVLPILILETYYGNAVEAAPGPATTLVVEAESAEPPPPDGEQVVFKHPVMRFVLTASMAFIWLAFLVEFVVKIAIAPSRVAYLTRNWIDMAIIVLPFLRPLRGMQALRAARLTQLSRAYRLRGVVFKGLRTAAAVFVGMETVRRLRGRFSKATAEEEKPHYEQWSRAALLSEIQRLTACVEALQGKCDRLALKLRAAGQQVDEEGEADQGCAPESDGDASAP